MVERILKNTILIVITVITLCCLFIFGVLFNHYNKEITSEMISEANYISKGVENQGIDYLNNLGDINTRVTWVDKDGNVLFDNRADASAMENHRDRQERKEAMNSSTGDSVRYSSTFAKKTIYHAVRLTDGSIIRLSHTSDSVFRMVLGMLHPLLIVMVIAFFISLGLAVRLTNQLVKPLDDIDLEHPEEAKVYDEMAPFLSKIVRQNKVIKKAMNELSAQQNEFRMITENMQEGFIVIDKSARILSYNKSALTIFGADDNVEKRNILVLNRSGEFVDGVNQALQGRHSEIRLTLGERCFDIYINPVFKESNLAGAIIVAADVTEKEERDNLRREFTANVSHELKTPLTAISGTAEIIKNGIVASEDIPGFAENIYNDAQRLIRLVEDIIKLSQLDEEKNIPEKTSVDLHYLALDVASQLADVAAKDNITIYVHGGSTVINGVKPILREMMYNLCDNAIKYNKPGGKVDINVGIGENRVWFSVKDTGIGIPKNQQQRVFERFYRVDKSHSREVGGTGLGLSIVKHGTKLHNGTINVNSSPGKGTEITINIPV